MCIGLIGLTYAVHTHAQTVNVSVRQQNVKEVFSNLEKQTGVSFVYDGAILKGLPRVNIQVKNQSLDQVLQELGRQSGLKFKRDGNLVGVSQNTIKKNPITKQKQQTVYADTLRTLVGTVVDENGSAIEGVTVRVERTNQVVTTNLQGQFQVEKARTGDVLSISSIGFNSQRMVVNQSVFAKIKLNKATNSLDEVVVQAYGRTSQRLTTGNIARVTAKDIEVQPILDPIMALQGKVAGLSITPQSGYEGGPLSIEIRGRGTVNKNFTSDPLYIIDGVPLTTLDIGGVRRANGDGVGAVSRGTDQAGLSLSGGQNPLMGINMSDIESIEVLKDADATAIYGSRGANGVILITTKKGTRGKLQLQATATQGVKYVAKRWDFLNTQQYIAMREEAFRNDGIIPTVQNAGDIKMWSHDSYTDWQDYTVGGAGKYTNIQANLSGGSEQTTFRISGGLTKTKDITARYGGNQNGSGAISLNHQSVDRRFNMNVGVAYTVAKQNQISAGAQIDLPPNAPPAFDKDGNLNFKEWRGTGVTLQFAKLLETYESTNASVRTSMLLSYELMKGLVLRTNIGFNRNNGNQESLQPIAAKDPMTTPKPTGAATFAKSSSQNWIVEPQIEYNGTLASGKLNVLLGGTLNKSSSDVLTTGGNGFTSDDLLESIASAPVVRVGNSSGQYAYTGVFARIGYNIQNKYIVNLNGRRDGSSRFGPGNQFGNFGSIGAAWIASEENWLRNVLPKAISTVKLRGSYGLTGTDNVSDYQFLSQWGPGSPILFPYNGVTTLSPLNLPNPNFHWEVNKKLETALSISFLQDRINLEGSYYRNVCDNQLISLSMPTLTGFSSVTANSPAKVQNAGLEFTLVGSVLQKKDFSWDLNFNISFNHNKLLAYPDIEHSSYVENYQIGAPLSLIHLLQYTGVDPLTGVYTYADHNGDGVVRTRNGIVPGTGDDDRYIVLDVNPKYSGGFGTTIRYKTVSLLATFSYVKKTGKVQFTSAAGGDSNIPLSLFENHWQYPGQEALYARFTTSPVPSDFNFTQSTGAYTDASFIRLQTLALGYQLPSHWLKAIKVKNLSLNLSAQNLFVLTKYNGIDPETTGYTGMPPVRTITGGLSCAF
jgi:Outer membrane receptor proteins, mostly Fe transport